MIIGQEMAEIRHGGEGVRSHFWSLCGVAGFLETARQQKSCNSYELQYLRLVACTFWVGMYKFNPNGAQVTFVTHLLPTQPN